MRSTTCSSPTGRNLSTSGSQSPVPGSNFSVGRYSSATSGLQERSSTNRNSRPAPQPACFLQWAGIPVALPDHLDALAARRARLNQPDWAAPEVVFNVRNALVHPPTKLDEPEWPSDDESFEAWQFATWSLELAIVRLLGYQDTYRSRLRLNQPGPGNDEPVPWRH